VWSLKLQRITFS